jgi:putative hydrolase of the HAD superfamily
MLKVLLFDVDGVLVAGESFSAQLERDYGITSEMLAPFFTEKFLACLVGRADLKESLKSYLSKWGWRQSTDAFLDYWFQHEHNIDESLIDAIQSIRQQGIRCYLATNQEKYRTEYILTRMSFADKFDGVFASYQLACTKSDKKFYEQILCSLPDIQPKEILLWDDTRQNVILACEAGLNAELYCDFDDFAQKTAEYFLSAAVV